MPLPPETLVGRFELATLLGVGRMSSVYCAHDTGLKRDVALKVLTEPPHSRAGARGLVRRRRVSARADGDP
jgi:serine/threonine protein kinase